MEYKSFDLKVKEAEDRDGSTRFIGYASTYGNVDLGGDVILPGAFTQSIRRQDQDGYPLLLEHRSLIGGGKISDSPGGLVIEGLIDGLDEASRAAAARVKKRLLRGLSIGFLPVAGRFEFNDHGGRNLREVKLIENSLTPIPMNQEATVVSVKSLGDARALVTRLGSSEALEAGMLEELQQIEAEVKSLLKIHDPRNAINGEVMKALNSLAGEMRRF